MSSQCRVGEAAQRLGPVERHLSHSLEKAYLQIGAEGEWSRGREAEIRDGHRESWGMKSWFQFLQPWLLQLFFDSVSSSLTSFLAPGTKKSPFGLSHLELGF